MLPVRTSCPYCKPNPDVVFIPETLQSSVASENLIWQEVIDSLYFARFAHGP